MSCAQERRTKKLLLKSGTCNGEASVWSSGGDLLGRYINELKRLKINEKQSSLETERNPINKKLLL